MISRSTLITVALGLAAGATVGALTFRSSAGSDTSTRTPHSDSQPTQETAVNAGLDLRPFDNEERISRVFSALQQPVYLRLRHDLFEAVRDLTAKDLPVLIKQVESLRSETAFELLPALLERWFELDVPAAQTWVLAHMDNWRLREVWARAVPEEAFRFASASTETWASWVVRDALNALYGADKGAQVARAKTLPPGELRNDVLAGTLAQWAEHDPAAAYAAVEEIPEGTMRDDIRHQLLCTWAAQDPRGALEKVSEILPTLPAGVLGHELVTQVISRIASKDPKLALEWLSGIPEELRWAPSIAVARQWTTKESLAALEWCMANGVDIAQANWRDTQRWDPAVLGGAMENAPVETFAFLSALPSGTERDRLLECAFMESLWHTPKEQLFQGEEGLAWRFFRQLPEDAQISKAALFGEKFAESGNLTDISAWGRNFTSGPARTNAISGAMGAVYQGDGSNVDTLLATVSAPADRDAALLGLTRAMRSGAPADAADRATGIGDITLRREALEGVVLPWLKSDPTASQSWLQKTGSIPATWKAEWLEQSRAVGLQLVGG